MAVYAGFPAALNGMFAAKDFLRNETKRDSVKYLGLDEYVDALIALGAAMASLHWLSRGWGYEITGLDVYSVYDYAMKADLSSRLATIWHDRSIWTGISSRH